MDLSLISPKGRGFCFFFYSLPLREGLGVGWVGEVLFSFLFSYAKVRRIIYIASDLIETLRMFNNKSFAIYLSLLA